MTPPSASGGFVEAQPFIERLLKPPEAAITETTPCAHSLESAAPCRCIEKGGPNEWAQGVSSVIAASGGFSSLAMKGCASTKPPDAEGGVMAAREPTKPDRKSVV